MRKIHTHRPAKAVLSETTFFNFGSGKPNSQLPQTVGLVGGRVVPGLIVFVGPIERDEETQRIGRRIKVVYREN